MMPDLSKKRIDHGMREICRGFRLPFIPNRKRVGGMRFTTSQHSTEIANDRKQSTVNSATTPILIRVMKYPATDMTTRWNM